MNPDIIQQIFDELQNCLPEDWQRVALRFEDVPDVKTSVKFYVNCGQGYIQCFDLVEDIRVLYPTLVSIKDILTKEKATLPQKDKWTVFTFIVDEQGDFNAYYDYDYRAENELDYEAEWEKKYLV